MTEDIKMNLQVDLSKVNKFHKELDQILQAKTEQDQDLVLVHQFIEDLDKVSREMQPLDENDNIGYVLITKLKKVYEVYKDTVLSNNDFDYLIDYYSHLQTKDEENQVVENPIPLFMQLSKHKKMVDTVKGQPDKKEDTEVKNMKITCTYKTYSLDITKEEGSIYFKGMLVGNVYSEPRKITNQSLEKVLHIYKAHIDSFNTGVLGHLMELTVKCGERTLDTFKYDPNINKVLGNFLFIVKKGEEDSLDKLVVSFQEEVDKENRSMTFKYKGFVLRLGLVDTSYGTTELGGHCEELNYKTFEKSKEIDIANFKSYINNHPIGQYKAKEKKKDIPQFKMQFLSTNGKVITVPCHITEDESIHCEPFKENATIVGWSLKDVPRENERVKNNEVGVIFEYNEIISKVKKYNENGYFNCDVENYTKVTSSSIDTLYEKFKKEVDEMRTR